MPKRKPHPVPITLGKFHNPKISDEDWVRWREAGLADRRKIAPVGDNGRKLPVRYEGDDDA